MAGIAQIKRAAWAVARCATAAWPDHSRLFLVNDRSGWVIDWEARELEAIAARLGIRTAAPRWLRYSRRQAMFFASQFYLLSDAWFQLPHRVGVAYFHGRPGSGEPEFDQLFEQLQRRHEQIDRVQVSHSEMEQVVLSSGIAPGKVFRIPIGVHGDFFRPPTAEARAAARRELGIPPAAVVAGSFQKDGTGWGEGHAPKRIKGPDVFLEAMRILRDDVPALHVLLSGPARGFVKRGLDELGIPYTHRQVAHYPDIRGLYDALDVYVVASRQEGGPKAVLEAMASGVPLVTTRVGQAMDLVQHGRNGWMVDVEDAEGLAQGAARVIGDDAARATVIAGGCETAAAHDYRAQDALWRAFFDGFVVGGRSQ